MDGWKGVALLVAALLGTGGIGAPIRSNIPKGTRENALIDQYQEHSREQDAAIASLQSAVRALQRREHVRDDYIMLLRQHIAEGKPPPPPSFPPALIT